MGNQKNYLKGKKTTKAIISAKSRDIDAPQYPDKSCGRNIVTVHNSSGTKPGHTDPGMSPVQANIAISAEFKDNQANLTDEEKQLLDLVNQERITAGLAMFEVHDQLVQLARLKSKDMYYNCYFRHTSPNYGSAISMEKKAGFSARVMGAENIARAGSVLRTHELIMHSDNHRKNVLDVRHTLIGIGIFKTPYGVYVTQLFAGN